VYPCTVGGFNVSLLGSVTCLNIWSTIFSEHHLKELAGCQNEGDLFNLKPESMQIHGGIEVGDKTGASHSPIAGKLLVRHYIDKLSTVQMQDIFNACTLGLAHASSQCLNF